MRLWIAAAALVTIPLVARAQEEPAPAARDAAKTYELQVPDRWEVGEVVTWTERNHVEVTATAAGEGAQTTSASEVRTDRQVVVWRCIEVDDAQAVLRAHAYVKSWAALRQGREDTSATGAFVEVTREGWRLLTPGLQPSPKAKAWMEKEFGRRCDVFDKTTFNKLHEGGPVAVGAKWHVAPEKLLGASGGAGATPPLDPSQIETSVELVAADERPEGVAARLAFRMAGALVGPMRNGGREVPLGEGSRLDLGGEMSALLGRSQREAAARAKGEIRIVVIGDGTGASAPMTAKFQLDLDHAAGGEMPPVPEAPPAADEPKVPTPGDQRQPPTPR